MDGDEEPETNGRAGTFIRRLWHGRGDGRTPWVRRILAVLFFFALPAPILLLLIFRFAPVPVTPQILLKLVTFNEVHYAWRGPDEISPYLGRAVIGSEDQNFCNHDGFDWKELQDAWRDYRVRHKPLRGASTISQQTAKNLFLSQNRNWARKGVEAYLTVLLEALWPKRRIIETYLNIAEWGPDRFGAEEAAEANFKHAAAKLSPLEAARLATVLPNPRGYRADKPGPYVARQSQVIAARMEEVRRDRLDACIYAESLRPVGGKGSG